MIGHLVWALGETHQARVRFHVDLTEFGPAWAKPHTRQHHCKLRELRFYLAGRPTGSRSGSPRGGDHPADGIRKKPAARSGRRAAGERSDRATHVRRARQTTRTDANGQAHGLGRPNAHRPPHRGGSANEDEVRSSALRAQVHGRSHAGFTQAELAEPMGTTRSATVRMEGGAVRPALATLDKLASAGWRRAGRWGRREPFGQLLHRQAGARATPPSAGPADRTRGRVMGGLGAG
jgi:hypothetical protein